MRENHFDLCDYIQLEQNAKRVFLQPQLLRNIDSIIQLFFLQCNHYLLDERDK